MNEGHSHSTEEEKPAPLDRRAFLTASAGLVAAPLAAPLLSGVAAHAQAGATTTGVTTAAPGRLARRT